jgi:AcrR family transcriptional regulator
MSCDGIHLGGERSLARKAKPKTPPANPDAALIAAAMALAASRGWRGLAMADIAAEAGIPLADALRIFPDRNRLLSAFRKRIDADVMAGAAAHLDAEETPRDRLFDVLMRRFDALAPHKRGIGAALSALPGEPPAALCHGLGLLASMRLSLELAGIPAAGISGRLKAKGLAAVYANALRAWLKDDTTDMAPTMAALDRGLMQAERLAGVLWPTSQPEPTPEA